MERQNRYLWSEQLGLYLGVHDGLLRYFTSQGELVPRPEETATAADERAAAANERAELEAQRAELEAQRAAAADKRAKRLAAKLRELNIDPDKIQDVIFNKYPGKHYRLIVQHGVNKTTILNH